MAPIFPDVPADEVIVTFVTYSLVGNELNAGAIFSALQYLIVLQMPMGSLPLNLAAIADAKSALGE